MTPYESAEIAWMRHSVESRARSGLRFLDLTLATEPIIGTLPEKLLNARVIAVPNSSRPLIILNDELFRLPYDVCRAAIEAFDFTDADGRLSANLDPDTMAAYLLKHPEIESSFEFSVLRYLHRVNQTIYDGTPTADSTIGSLKSRLFSGLADAIELFVISHEFAHLFLKHDPGQSNKLDLLGVDGKQMIVNESPYSWRQEFAADAFGFAIMDAALKSEADQEFGSYLKSPFYPFYVSAPRFFFTLMFVVEDADAVIDTGVARPRASQQEIALAMNAIANMFEPPGSGADQPTNVSSHPAFVFRAALVQKIERASVSQFMKQSDLGDGISGLERFSDGFVTALLALSHSAERDFNLLRTAKNARSQSPATQEVSVSDVSANVIYTELKERGIDPVGQGAKADLTDAFIDYHYRSDGKALNLQATQPEIQKSAEVLSVAIGGTSLRSRVTVKTKTAGARVRYRLIGRQSVNAFSQLTNEASEPLTIGLYNIWSERNGTATSSQTEVFRIIRPELVVDVEERQDASR